LTDREGNGVPARCLHLPFKFMEEALDLIYRGKRNVAVKAEELSISTATLKRLVRDYILERPLDTSDPEVWSGDVELGWPWT